RSVLEGRVLERPHGAELEAGQRDAVGGPERGLGRLERVLDALGDGGRGALGLGPAAASGEKSECWGDRERRDRGTAGEFEYVDHGSLQGLHGPVRRRSDRGRGWRAAAWAPAAPFTGLPPPSARAATLNSRPSSGGRARGARGPRSGPVRPVRPVRAARVTRPARPARPARPP